MTPERRQPGKSCNATKRPTRPFVAPHTVETGWTSFDENAPAYTPDQVAAERARYTGAGV